MRTSLPTTRRNFVRERVDVLATVAEGRCGISVRFGTARDALGRLVHDLLGVFEHVRRLLEDFGGPEVRFVLDTVGFVCTFPLSTGALHLPDRGCGHTRRNLVVLSGRHSTGALP